MDKRIWQIAEEETSPALYERFTPITRGPLFALLGLTLLAIIALPYLIFRFVFRFSAKIFLKKHV